MKLIITGYAGHGKDTACEYLRDKYGLSFESSSRVLLEEVIYPKLKDKYGYKDKEECYLDRVNHRAEWFDLLKEFNNPDLTALAKIIFSKYDIYCGLRNCEELHAIKKAGLVDKVIWIDAIDRVPEEPTSSITITEDDANFIVYNKHDLEAFYRNLDGLVKLLGIVKGPLRSELQPDTELYNDYY